jgi:hypothetical protein
MHLKEKFGRLLLVVITAAFTVSAIAAGIAGKKDKEPGDDSKPTVATGVVVGSGDFRINDLRVLSGATVTSGSTVETGSDGDASVDLGPFGHLRIRPNTTVKLIFEEGSCVIAMERCGSLTEILPDGVSSRIDLKESKLTQVAATKGEAVIDGTAMSQAGNTSLLREGEARTYSKIVKLTAKGDAAFTLNCCGDCKVPGLLVGPPVYGIAGFLAAGAATVRGISPTDKPPTHPEVSPIQ